jgi:hypothetical protein
MPLSKTGGGKGNTKSGINSRSRAARSGNWRKMEPVKLPETTWITKPMTRTNQGPGATIMDRTSIRIKNDTTTMISNLARRKELQVMLRYKRNIRHMKLESGKSAMTTNRKSTISSLNRHRRRKRTHRTKMCTHVSSKRRLQNQGSKVSTRLWELQRVSGGRRDYGWIEKGKTML